MSKIIQNEDIVTNSSKFEKKLKKKIVLGFKNFIYQFNFKKYNISQEIFCIYPLSCPCPSKKDKTRHSGIHWNLS